MDRLAALLDFNRLDPDDPFTRFAIAQEYRNRDDFAQALTFFGDLIHDHPNYVGTYFHLGKLYIQLDRTGEAIMTYRAGIDAATKNGDLHARAELQNALLEAEGIGFDD